MNNLEIPKQDSVSAAHLKHRKNFLTVGIGASAGGIKALKEFFAKMPFDSGMAFIVVLHLSQNHESNLAGILGRASQMPVVQVQEPTRIEQNHVYVVPPAKQLEMVDGVVRLAKPERVRGQRVAIDRFFRTLADAFGESAVCIVMSGAGEDGTLGLKKIKEENGFAIVQDPKDAEYDQMPLSAIRTGIVDWVLPIAAMPTKLLTLKVSSQELRLTKADESVVAPELNNATALRDILTVLRVRTGHDFSDYKQSTLLRRIGRHLQIHELEKMSDYAEYIRDNPDEALFLLKNLLINVTNFFRDREAYEILEQDVVPRLFAGKTAGDHLRVWVAGCATGEEAYSIGMLLLEYASKFDDAPKVQIFASDADEEAIAQAREGRYPETIVGDVAPERLRRFFVKQDKVYRVKKELRETILFAPHNILRDPPFSKLDLISCRNLMIYLNRETQERLIQLLHFALNSSGFLFLGSSESAENLPLLFSPFDKKQKVYLRRPTNSAAQPPQLTVNDRWQARATPTTTSVGGRTFSFGELHFNLLEKYAPPSILINEEHEIVHLSENAGRYLQFVGGEPSNNLLKVVVPDLRADLRAALFTAKQQQKTAESRRVRTRVAGEEQVINLIVHPITAPDHAGGFMLVVFEENNVIELAAKTSKTRLKSEADNSNVDLLARQLEEELRRTKDRLRVTVEQYDTSIEELKAANEELQAINEELRSATEELETSKEELQSVNEELTTVNNELKEKIDEVSYVNSDLQNLMHATDISTIFLDRELHIKRFTTSAQQLFNLITTDIGRPLEHLTNSLDYKNLGEDARQVLRTLRTLEREVKGDNGQTFIARLLPYRTTDDKIDGVVLSFIDITERKQTEETLRKSEAGLRLILESVDDYAIFTLTPDGRINSWNAGAERIFGYTERETLDQSTEIIFTPEDREQLVPEQEINTAIENGRASGERWHLRKDGSRFFASGMLTILGETPQNGFVKILRDLTARKQFEDALKEGDRRKDEFLATLAHELRNPLAPIRTALEIMANNGGNEKTENARLVIERQTARLVHLVDDLLDISRITKGKIKLRKENVDVSEAINAAVEMVAPFIENCGHKLDLRLPDAPVYVEADPMRLAQIMQNLLHNSAKYTEPGGHIIIIANRENNQAVMRVRDNGVGIAAEMLPKVFDMFAQTAVSDKRGQGGLGIGLSLVKKLVEMHNGKVEAHSEGESKGSEFIVRLPLAQNQKKMTPANKEESKANAATATANPGSSPRRILVVDDNTDAAEMLQIALETENYATQVAADGATALAVARGDDQPDLAILDIGLPDTDGYELARNLREILPNIKLIALSGWGQDEDRQRSAAAGFDYHLVKPIKIEDLLKLLK